MTPAEMAQAALPKLEVLARGGEVEFEGSAAVIEEVLAALRLLSSDRLRIKSNGRAPLEVWIPQCNDVPVDTWLPTQLEALNYQHGVTGARRFVEDMSGREEG